MKIWVDDIRPAPKGYIWCKTVHSTKFLISLFERKETISLWEYTLINEAIDSANIEYSGELEDYLFDDVIEVLDLDHDAGKYAKYGGDFIKILDWMEETGRSYPVRFHTANPVGKINMELIARKNGWKIIK